MTAIRQRVWLAAVAGVTMLLSCARSATPPLVRAERPPEIVDATPEAAPLEPPAPEAPSEEKARSAEAQPEVTATKSQRSLRPIPARVKVGLATDLESVTIPCCEQDVVAVVARRELAAVSSLEVEPAVAAMAPPLWRLQVAALRDETQAGELANRLAVAMEMDTAVVFDAGTGLYRVRAGSFSSREEAEVARLALAQRNIHDVWIVSEQARVRDPSLRLTQGSQSWLVRGRWLAFESPSGKGISLLGGRYRGRILVFLNDRGTLNLINEVGLDDYLRGVVPREMGPKIYDEIEALKAQTVAARSYTLRNMGEFADEGFDICATPRCQVYGGMDAENELSDRAVLETSGEVLAHGGDYADAMYSSTCGGHTENVEVVFPLKEAPYLRGVPCHEAGVDRIAGSLEPGHELERGVSRILAPPTGQEGSATDLAVRLKMIAGAAGLEPITAALGSLERREVQAFVAAQLGLSADARLLVTNEDVPYMLQDPPVDWGAEDLRLAAYLVRMGFFSSAVSRPLSARDVDEILFRAAMLLRVVEDRSVRYLGSETGELLVKEESAHKRYALPANMATFTRQGGRFVSAPITLVPGDRLRLFVRQERVLAIAHEIDPDGVAYDRTSNLSSWTRFRSLADIRRSVSQRYPGFELNDLAVAERGISGRVRRLLLVGSDSSTIEVTGLPIRWTLDLPDTLFTAKRLKPPAGDSGWLFSGRGWGHGVGMCQVGSYGMALRGHSYRDILHHYYSGVDIVSAPREQPLAGSPKE